MNESMDERRLEAELRLARDAAAEAAALLLARSGSDRVREKARADLVTEVDEAAERLITARIREAFPADSIVAEEFAVGEIGEGRTWVIDPLDGTINYVHGHPFVCVSIGLVDAAGPAVGVIHAPFLGEVYEAVRGRGAWLNGERISVSRVEDPAAGLYATGFPFRKGKGDPERYMAMVTRILVASHGVRRAGAAALDLAYVAAGRVEAFFELGLHPWDVAAGILLVTEAGGQVSAWPGDRVPPLHSGRIVASNGHVHGWVVEMLGE